MGDKIALKITKVTVRMITISLKRPDVENCKRENRDANVFLKTSKR